MCKNLDTYTIGAVCSWNQILPSRPGSSRASGCTNRTPATTTRCWRADGSVRPHWRHLTEPLEEMGEAGFARRWQEGRRLIHDNGITYNVYSDPQSTGRPWPLDPLPLILDSAEWESIAAAIDTARHAVELDSGGSLRTAEIAARLPAAGTGVSESGVSAALLQRAGAGRCLSAHLRSRSGAFARRPLVGDCRSHAGALRAPVTRWRIGWSPPACCPMFSAPRTFTAWPLSSRLIARRCVRLRPGGRKIRASWC